MGKQLRIDVHGDDFPSDPNQNYAIPPTNPFVGKTGADEIWAYGLRNPFRASFDRDTGDLWIGDVGQDQREEVDMQPESKIHPTDGSQPVAANYGWRLREGNIQTPGSGGGAPPADYVPPVYDYDHSGAEHGTDYSGNVIIGGYVYRGPDKDLQGKYFFADEGANRVWELDPATSAVTNIVATLNSSHISNITSFAEDTVGNLYYLNFGNGTIYELTATDYLPGDYNADGTVDAADYTVWRDNLGKTVTTPGSGADGDGNGTVGPEDYTVWLNNFGRTVHTASRGAAVPEPASLALLFQLIAIGSIMRLVGRR
jgi:hypothetical protein